MNTQADKGEVVYDHDFLPDVMKGKAVALEEIPGAVIACIDSLSTINKKVQDAANAAENAKQDANLAAAVKPGFFNKGKVIEGLQDAMKGMSAAQIEQSAAMQALLKYQQQIATTMKFLVQLGTGSMAATRIVYKQMQMQMRGASVQELDEMAKQELKNTLRQLKNQLDMMEQQERTQNAVKKNQDSIRDINALDQAQETELARQRNKDDEHDSRLDAQEKMIIRLEAEIRRLKKGKEDVLEAAKIEDGNPRHAEECKFYDEPLETPKLYRCSEGRIIAGVCKGLSNRYVWNVWGIRVLWLVAAIFLWGIPVIAYLVMAFALKPTTDKPKA